MKQRLTNIDIKAIIKPLKEAESTRLQNIYELATSNRTLLLKFNSEPKRTILIESGVRAHLTKYEREKAPMPSPFVSMLRKYLKNRRLDNVYQLKSDRVIILSFGDLYLVCEFYAGGNIILIVEGKIRALIRRVDEGESHQKYAVGEPFDVSTEEVKYNWDAEENSNNKKWLQAKYPTFPNPFINYILSYDSLKEGLNAAREVLENIDQAKGYLYLKDGKNEDYAPFLIKGKDYKEYNDLSLAMDEYYSTLESFLQTNRTANAISAAEKKINDHKARMSLKLNSLDQIQDVSQQKATLISLHQENVDLAIQSINSLLEKSMHWNDIKDVVDLEARRGNEVASLIQSMDLEKKKITLRLSFPDDEDDIESDDEERNTKEEEKFTDVQISLTKSAWQNSTAYFDNKRTAAVKKSKTEQAEQKALKNTQKKIEQDLKKQLSSATAVIRPLRHPFWFEKYLWFVSSENYLILAGRDAQQNELLYRRHFKKGDIYVHADLQGAATVIIKNKSPTQDVSPSTISQAGSLSVAYSKAWDQKFMASAWWVTSEQVSKTAPTGEYLTTGSFMIRGKKNYLPAAKLEVGFGLLWVVDEESASRHHLKQDTEREMDTNDSQTDEISDEVNHLSAEEDDSQGISDDSEGTEISQPDDVGFSNDENSLKAEPELDEQAKDLSLKSDGDLSNSEDDDAQDAQDANDGNTAAQLDNNSSPKKAEDAVQNSSNKTKQVRGKKGQKKRQQKYADQDEEERKLRTELLGSAKGLEREIERKAKVESDRAAAKEKRDKIAKYNQQRVETYKEKETKDNLSDDEEEDIKLDTFDNLIAFPEAGDTILNVLPVCAPYSAMQRYKYKVKILPGNAKKTKIAQQALQAFASGKIDEKNQDKELVWAIERDLMKGIKDAEAIAPIGVRKGLIAGQTKKANQQHGKGGNRARRKK